MATTVYWNAIICYSCGLESPGHKDYRNESSDLLHVQQNEPITFKSTFDTPHPMLGTLVISPLLSGPLIVDASFFIYLHSFCSHQYTHVLSNSLLSGHPIILPPIMCSRNRMLMLLPRSITCVS